MWLWIIKMLIIQLNANLKSPCIENKDRFNCFKLNLGRLQNSPGNLFGGSTKNKYVTQGSACRAKAGTAVCVILMPVSLGRWSIPNNCAITPTHFASTMIQYVLLWNPCCVSCETWCFGHQISLHKIFFFGEGSRQVSSSRALHFSLCHVSLV